MGQPSYTHIQNLARAGIATHVIFDDNLVDPVFAMAKARDMPDVHFAALFENDTLVLGCPDGLPAELSKLAKPIVVGDGPASPPPQRAARASDLTRHTHTPSHTGSHPPPVERRAQPTPPPALSHAVLEAIQSLTTALSTHAKSQVDALNTLTQTIQTRPNNQPDLTEIKYVLQSMQQDMAHLTARARRPAQPADQQATLASFGTSLTNTLGRLEQMAARMEQRAAPPQATHVAPTPAPPPAPTPPVQASIGHPVDMAQADSFDLITSQSGQQHYAPHPPAEMPTAMDAPAVFPAYARQRYRHPVAS